MLIKSVASNLQNMKRLDSKRCSSVYGELCVLAPFGLLPTLKWRSFGRFKMHQQGDWKNFASLKKPKSDHRKPKVVYQAFRVNWSTSTSHSLLTKSYLVFGQQTREIHWAHGKGLIRPKAHPRNSQHLVVLHVPGIYLIPLPPKLPMLALLLHHHHLKFQTTSI